MLLEIRELPSLGQASNYLCTLPNTRCLPAKLSPLSGAKESGLVAHRFDGILPFAESAVIPAPTLSATWPSSIHIERSMIAELLHPRVLVAPSSHTPFFGERYQCRRQLRLGRH